MIEFESKNHHETEDNSGDVQGQQAKTPLRENERRYTSLREYLHSTDKDNQRLFVTQRIGQIAREYVDLSKRKTALVELVRNKKASFEEITKAVSELENALQKKEGNLLSRWWNREQIQFLQQELQVKIGNQDELEKDYDEHQRLLAELHEQIENRSFARVVRELLEKFASEWTERWEEDETYWREQRERAKSYETMVGELSVERLAEKYNQVFLHGIRADNVPAGNSLLHQWTDWRTKLKIALTIEPTLAASSIRPDDTMLNMWSRMGLVLNRGRILDAAIGDIGSKARSTEGREVDQINTRYGRSLAETVHTAMTGTRVGGNSSQQYNEFSIDNPGVSGFYICLEQSPLRKEADLAPRDEVLPEVTNLGLPLYLVEGGSLYRAEYDPKARHRVRKINSNPVTLEEINHVQYKLSTEQRHQMLDDIFEDSPFELIGGDELQQINARSDGGEYYMLLRAKQGDMHNLGTVQEYQPESGEKTEHWLSNNLSLCKGTSVRRLVEVTRVGARVEYFAVVNNIIRREINRVGTVNVRKCNDFQEWDLQSMHDMRLWRVNFFKYEGLEWLRHGDELTAARQAFEQSVTNVESFLRELGEAIRDHTIKYQEAMANNDTKRSNNYNRILNKWACFLYGFSEQAKALGDITASEQAETLARTIFSEERYRSLLMRRIDDQGRFRITQQDIDQHNELVTRHVLSSK